MKKFYFIFVLLAYTFSSIGQLQWPKRPYEKLQFDNLDIIWYESTFDSTMRGILRDGYSHLRVSEEINPIIFENKIVTFYTIHANNGPEIGAYIDCQDIYTGKLIWRDRYGRQDSERVEVPIKAVVIDGKLKVYSKMSRKLNDTIFLNGALHRNMVLSLKVYDITDGTLIDFRHGDLEDPSLLTMEYGKFYYFKSYMFAEKDKIRYLEINRTPTSENLKFWINSYALDQDGKVLTKDSILNSQVFFNVVQIHEDTLLMTAIDTFGMIFRYLSPELKEYYSIRSKNEFDHHPINMYIKDVSIENRKILFYNQRNKPLPDRTYETYVYDFNGNFLVECDFLDQYKPNYFPLNWTSNPNIYFDYTLKTGSADVIENYLTCTEIKNVNEEIVIKKIPSKDSLRYAIPIWSKKVKGDKVLISLFETALYFDTLTYRLAWDANAVAHSYILVKEESLGIISNVQHEQSTPLVEIFPNPTSDVINVESRKDLINQIDILDISGHVLKQKIFNDQKIQLDMSKFASGIYFLNLKISNHVITKKIVVL